MISSSSSLDNSNTLYGQLSCKYYYKINLVAFTIPSKDNVVAFTTPHMTFCAPSTGDGTCTLIVHFPSRISIDLEYQVDITASNMLTWCFLCTLVK